jgi:hypothetical protein
MFSDISLPWRFRTISPAEVAVQRTAHIIRELLVMIGLLGLSFYVVYMASPDISRVFFIILLLAFVLSRDNHFWFAFFFILAQGPGYLWADYSGLSQYRLPMYTPVAGMTFTPIDFFVLLAFAKALFAGRKTEVRMTTPMLAILAYAVVCVVITALLFGTDIDVMAWNFRWVFYYSLMISFLFLVRKKHEVHQFILLIFPAVFFILFTQVYYTVSGAEFINLFDPGFRGVMLNTVTGQLRPVMGGVLLVFFCFVSSLLLLLAEDHRIPRVLLHLVVVTSFLSVFLSATRVWFVIFSLVFFGYVLVSKKKISSTLGIISLLLLLAGGLIYAGIVPEQLLVESSWARMRQIFDVAKGNFFAVQTAMNRIAVQLPVLVNTIKQSPLVGFGFSFVTMKHYDDDFGFLNTVLMFGLIGFAFFLFFFYRLIALLRSTARRINKDNPYRARLKMMSVVWLSILVGYLTTWDFFTMYFYKVFFVAIVIALSQYLLTGANDSADTEGTA